MDVALRRKVAAAQELPANDKKPPLKREVQHEDTAFDFVEAHPDLYSKRHTDLMKTHREDALRQHIAVTLSVTYLLPNSQVQHFHALGVLQLKFCQPLCLFKRQITSM